MKTRDYVLVNGETIADSATVTKNLDRNLKIQEIRVRYQATNGATSNTLAKLNGMVTKIEVVNGSDVLHSLSGQEEQALNFFRHRSLPFKQLNSKAAGVVIEEFIVNFGRFRGDRDFYLDTGRFSNPQLKLTHALTISATAGFATGTGLLTVILKLIEDNAPPSRGFIQSQEIKAWTTLGSGDEDTDLPLDFPFQSIMVKDLETLIEPDVDLTNLKLNINSGRWIPFDLSTALILADNIDRFGKARERMNYLNGAIDQVNYMLMTWSDDVKYDPAQAMSFAGEYAKSKEPPHPMPQPPLVLVDPRAEIAPVDYPFLAMEEVKIAG